MKHTTKLLFTISVIVSLVFMSGLAWILATPSTASAESSLIERLKGKILLRVEHAGEAWYINPDDGERYYMGRPQDAFNLMRNLGLGITDENLFEIPLAEGNYDDWDNSELDLYLGDELGYSYYYPMDWTLNRDGLSDSLNKEVFVAPQDAEPMVNYFSVSLETRSLEAIRNVYLQESNDYTEKIVSIDKETAYQYINKNNEARVFYVWHNGQGYSISTQRYNMPEVRFILSTFSWDSFDVIITILVPENISAYETAMTEYTQTGQGDDPSETMTFVERQTTVQGPVEDIIWRTADIAAAVIVPSGGPETAEVQYLKIENKTAYVLLNIDLESWAGFSVAIAKIHPLVEKSLLKFDELNTVVFDFAPGEDEGDIIW